MANPYLINTAAGSGGATIVISAVTATGAGDKIVVGAVVGTGTVTGVTDSAGNTYVQQESDTGGVGSAGYEFVADGATSSIAAGGTITVTCSSTTTNKGAVAVGVPGMAATAMDKIATADNAASAAPSVTSPALTQASETVVAVIANTNSGGDPTWGSGFTKLGSTHNGSGPWVSVSYKTVNSTAAVTASGTIGLTSWTAMLVTLKNASSVTVTSPAPPNGTVGSPYLAPNETAAGGSGTYTWAKTAGTLPAGVAISSAGVWSGTPTGAGTFTFTITATDANAVTGSASQTITVNTTAVTGIPYLVGSNSANSGGGTTLVLPVSNPVSAGDTIMVAALSSVSLVVPSVTDTAGNAYGPVATSTAQTSAQLFTFESDGSNALVAGVDTIIVTYSANTSVQAAIAVGDNNVSGGDKVAANSGSSTAPSSGATATLTQAEEHSIAFIVDAAAGGVPTWAAPWSSNVVANVQGGAGARLSAAYQVVNATTALTASGTILTAPWAAAIMTMLVNPVRNNLQMAGAVQGEVYSQTLEASGGVSPYTWTIPVGTLPTGLSLASGVVSGTPSVNGTFTFTTRATDFHGVTGDLVQTIIILPNVPSGAPAMALPNNLLSSADADAESGSPTWAADINAATPTVTTQIALTGVKCFAWSALADGLTQVATGFYAVQPSQSYIGSGFLLPAAARDCLIGVSWYTSGNVFIRTDYGTDNPSSTNAWQPQIFNATSPSNAAKAKVVYQILQANKGEVQHFDLSYFTQSDGQVLIDWINPTFTVGGAAGNDFMDVTLWTRLDQGITLSRGRQDSISEIQPGSVSFTLQNDTGLFTRKKVASLIALIGGAVTVQRRYQINLADEFGVWHTRADGPISEGGYTFSNNGIVSTLQVTATDILALLNRQDALACWTKEEVLSDAPLYHWSLNDSGNTGGSGLAAETSGNNGPPLRTWNSDNTKTATIGFQDSSGGVETLADAVLPGQPDGGEFWTPGSNQPTSQLRGLDSGGVGPYGAPLGSVYLTPKLTAQSSYNLYVGNIGYQLTATLPDFIDPSKSSYSFEIWFTMDPGIKTSIATKYGPYTPLSLGSSIDGNCMIAGIFPTGTSPHNFKVNTYAQPPGFQGRNFTGAGVPATTNSITQTLPADTVAIPHHLVITIQQDPLAPTVTGWLDGVQFSASFTLPVGQKYDTICIGGAWRATGCHWGGVSLASIYNYVLGPQQIITHCQMGQYGSWEQTTDDCIATVAGYTNAPNYWVNVSGKHFGLSLTEYQDITGSNGLAAMQLFEKAEGGLIYVDATGSLNFHTRDHRMGHGAPNLLLPPDTFSGDLGYNITDQFMTNEMGVATQVFQTGASFINTVSQQNYGVYSQNSVNSPLQLPLITWSRAFGVLGLTSFYYFSDPHLNDRAAWESNSHAEPWLTPGQVQVDLLTLNKTSTGLGISNFYALEIDDMIAPSGTLPVSFPDANLSREWFIEGITETFSLSARTIAFYCSPAETQRAWIPGDAVYGVLGSTSRIGISGSDVGPEVAIGKDVSHDAGRPYWPPAFQVGMNNADGTNNGFVGGQDIRGLTDNLGLMLNPPMLVVGAALNTQSIPSGSNTTPQIFWDNIFADTAGGMGLASGWPNWYVVTVPGFYDIDASLIWDKTAPTGGNAAQGWILVAQAGAQALAAATGTPVTVGNYVCPIGEQVRVNASGMSMVDAPSTRLYLGLGDMVTVGAEQSTGATRTTGTFQGGSRFSMLWRGWGQNDDQVQLNSSVTGGSVTVKKTTTTYTKTYKNTHTYCYYGFAASMNRKNQDGDCIQGTYSGGRNVTGSDCSQVVFDHGAINSDLTVAGTVAIKNVTLKCHNTHTWYNSGGKLMLGYSTTTPGGSTFDAHSVSNRDAFEESFSEGQTKTFNIPSTFATTFQGSGKMFVVGDSRTEDLNKYGIWQGGPNQWTLTITYTVTV